MKNIVLKRITAIALLILTVGLYIEIMQATVANPDNEEYRGLRSFYLEPPNTLDVVVMGASEIKNGYSAAEAYRYAGYTSFPYAININSVLLWKYELKDIERLQHPHVLIIETNGALYLDDKLLNSEYCINTTIESMPMSINRVKSAFSLSKTPLDRLLPYFVYHKNWTKIRNYKKSTNYMISKQGHARLRGIFNYTSKETISKKPIYPLNGDEEALNPIAERELEEFLDECKKSSIEHVVFLEYPHIINDEEMYSRQCRSNRAKRMILDAGFDYIDLNVAVKEIGLDYSADFFDAGHLYASGQRKTTHYLADIIKENYIDAVKQQSEENKKEWIESADLMSYYYMLSDRYIEKDSNLQLLENRRTMKAIEKLRDTSS